MFGCTGSRAPAKAITQGAGAKQAQLLVDGRRILLGGNKTIRIKVMQGSLALLAEESLLIENYIKHCKDNKISAG